MTDSYDLSENKEENLSIDEQSSTEESTNAELENIKKFS